MVAVGPSLESIRVQIHRQNSWEWVVRLADGVLGDVVVDDVVVKLRAKGFDSIHEAVPAHVLCSGCVVFLAAATDGMTRLKFRELFTSLYKCSV